MIHDEMMQALCHKPHVHTRHRNKLHTLSRKHVKVHTWPKYPHYLNNPMTLCTYPKQQQQADFANAEEGTDSGDNDDRPSWQAGSDRSNK
jgi:hypothetical protein